MREPTKADEPTAYRDPGPTLTTNTSGPIVSGQKIVGGLEDVLAGRAVKITTFRVTPVEHDSDYDWIPPLPPMTPAPTRRGAQCGECGMKFDYDKTYGYACQNNRCPMR